MSGAERQDLEAKVEDLQARLLWAKASIDTLVKALERLSQSVSRSGLSKSKTFDAMFIERLLDGIRNGRPQR